MTDRMEIRDTLSSPHLPAIYEAQTLAALLQALAESVSGLLGTEPAAECSLILFNPESAAGSWVINQFTLHKRKQYRPYRLAEWLAGLGGEATRPLVYPGAPLQLLSLTDRQAPPLSAAPVETVVVPLASETQRLGVLALGLWNPGAAADPAIQEGLAQIAAALSRVLPRILQYERIESQNQQIQHLHEAMLKVMICPDRSSLLSSLLSILNRQFGFSRVIVAQVHAETQSLRNELHSGFDASFAPFQIPMEDARSACVQALRRGEVMILEGERAGLPADWPAFIHETPAERRVILPLRIGSKPVGLIYADQPLHDGSPLFGGVLEIFARLAAVAIENLGLRIRAEQRAETDGLTGLYNRYFLDKILDIEIPRVKRYNHPISLLMIDLRDFKHVNDTYGHQFGDHILRETSSLLQANVRRPDIVVRYGGDEFVVLMVNTTLEQARMVRERIERAFVERNRLQTDERMMIKISLGLRSADAQTIETLLHEADMEMYAHKARQTRAQLIVALISGSLEKIEAADRIVGSLCNILYKKAPYYPEHARRVAHMALCLARRLDMAPAELETLALAALLHDVGKFSIPTELLQKAGPLTKSEIAAMRHHPAMGAEFFQGLEHLEPLRPIIRSHHERYDGATTGEFPGYPDGLYGDRIPLAARILKLTESVDCLLSGRSYRPAAPAEQVSRILREEAGKSFDPHLVNILLADKNWLENFNDSERITELLDLEPSQV